MIELVVGSILALFLPGYLIVMLLFKEFQVIEKICFSVLFSIMITIAIGIALGFSESVAERTGGLTFENAMWAEINVIAILVALHLVVFLVKIVHRVWKKKYKSEQNSPKNGKS